MLLSMRNGPQSLEPKLPDDLVMAIGRVAVLGTRLESDVTGTLWTMSGLNPKPTLTTKRVDVFDQVIKRLKKYTRENFRGEPMTEILVWLHQAKAIQKQRHLIIHGIWSAFPVRANRHTVRTMRDGEQSHILSIDDVHEIADSIQRIRAGGRIVSHHFVAQNPEAGKTIRAMTVDEMKQVVERPDTPGIA